MVLLFAVVSSGHFLCGQLVEHDIKKDEEDGFCLKMVIDILTSQIIMIKIDVILLIISNLYFVRLVTSIAKHT